MQVLLVISILIFSCLSHAETINFKCNFDKYADPSGVKKGKFDLQFIIDTESKKSYMVGNNGSSEVHSLMNDDGGVSFLEVTGSGNIMSTSIVTTGEAVHSRNTIMFGKLTPSQYYGNCTQK